MMEFKAFNLTAQGASHIKKNRECQDASKSFFCEDYAIAVVCDGHGGDDYIRSAVGSEKASQIALENIREFIEQVDKDYLKRHFDTLLHSLEGSIISMWRSQIRNHWDANPITQEEESRLSEKAKRRYIVNDSITSAYGTTLIAVVATKVYWFCFQIGDGKCVWVDKNSSFDQLALDEKCFLNATTSLCDSDALEHFHAHYGEEIPAAVFIGSDGIDDCFKNDEQLYNFYKTMCYSFGTEDTDTAVAELKDFLPRLSQKGSGDDVSIAAILNMCMLPEIEAVTSFNRDVEREKKQNAEAEEAKKNAELREEYERKAEAIRKRLEEEKIMAEEELARQEAIKLRRQAADEEIKIVKAIQDLENAKKALYDTEVKLAKTEELKKRSLEKLQAVTETEGNKVTQEEYSALRKIADKHIDSWLKYNSEHTRALADFKKAKIVYDSVIGSIAIKCPRCNKLNPASFKFCNECGASLHTLPSKLVETAETIEDKQNTPFAASEPVSEEVSKIEIPVSKVTE